ncbi:MAG: PKD domain-containing protein [Methanobacteriota archaeon]|nr:MAG: PKD domain-containing protein [Euryarchaeota archaeon]
MRGNRDSYAHGAALVLVIMVVLSLTASSIGGDVADLSCKAAVVSAEPTCLLHGWVNDSVTHEGIGGAQVAFLTMTLWMDFTETNETGYYELMANRTTQLIVLCQKYGYYPSMDIVDTTEESDYRLDFELEAEPTVPETSITIEPDANISMKNRMITSFIAEDFNLLGVQITIGSVFNRTGEWLNFTPTSAGVAYYDSYEEEFILFEGDLEFYGLSYEDDILEGQAGWAALSSYGGYLSNSTCSEYHVVQFEKYADGDRWEGIAGLYYNETIAGDEGIAFFDGITGEYQGFEFYNLTTYTQNPIDPASSDDLEGEITPLIPVISWNLNESADFSEMANSQLRYAPLERRSVIDLNYDTNYIVHSGEYVALCLVFDEVYNVNGSAKLITVDTELPVAYAGEDIEANLGDTVVLEGSATDNVGIVSYIWTFEDGDAEVTLEGDIVEYVFTEWGNHTAIFTVTDGGGNEDSDQVRIAIDPGDFPVAEAGPAEMTVSTDVPVHFDGTDSYDVDGEIVEYMWEIVELDLNFTDAEFNYTFSQTGIYQVELLVEDNLGLLSEPDTIIVTVTDGTSPTADAGDDIDVFIGELFTLSGLGSYDNVGITEYKWSCDELEYWEAFEAEVDVTIDSEGTYTFTLETRDAAGNVDTDEVVVTVIDPNEAPTADAGFDVDTVTGELVALNASGSYDDGDIVIYAWAFEYDGETITLYGETVEFTFDIAGTYVVTLTVEDAEGKTDEDTVTVTVGEDEEEEEQEDGDGKSFIESFGLPIGIIVALVVIALILSFVLKGRKGGKAPTHIEEPPDSETVD